MPNSSIHLCLTMGQLGNQDISNGVPPIRLHASHQVVVVLDTGTQEGNPLFQEHFQD